MPFPPSSPNMLETFMITPFSRLSNKLILKIGKPNNIAEGFYFFKTKFQHLKKDDNKTLIIHRTCCTDTEAMKAIVEGVV